MEDVALQACRQAMPRSPRGCGGQPTALPARMRITKVVWNSIITGASKVEKRDLAQEAHDQRRPAAEAARVARRPEPQRQREQLGPEQQHAGQGEQAVDLRPAVLRPDREEACASVRNRRRR